MRILVINGPNLNLLGKREPEIYGSQTLWDIENRLKEKFPKIKLEFYQSNGEGAIVDFLQKAMDGSTSGVVLNAGAYSHYSFAIRDAIAMLPVPVIEVHISNTYAREEFRRTSVLSSVCKGVIAGFGPEGYEMALEYLIKNANVK
ncbi:MAG TPA: type II 3-dehydroquinate dehydratase [Bacteroidota bacterium]